MWGRIENEFRNGRNLKIIAVVIVVLALGIVATFVILPGGTSGSHPPGTSDSGINTSLGAVHDEQLLALDSFTYEADTVRVTEDGVENVSYRLWADLTDEEYRSRRVVGPGSTNVTRYVGDGTTHERRVNGSGTFYRTVDDDRSPLERVRRLNRSIRTIAREGNFSYVGRTTVGDQEGYRYTATGVDPVVTGAIPAENVSAELIVGPEGFVRVFELTFTLRTANTTRLTTIRARFGDLGDTDVSRPGWADDPPALGPVTGSRKTTTP